MVDFIRMLAVSAIQLMMDSSFMVGEIKMKSSCGYKTNNNY
jgi:hypothetical protein